MDKEYCTIWQPIEGVISPCADISMHLHSPRDLSVILHFSRVVGNPPRDLELIFKGCISIRWEDECFGLTPLPDTLPRCTDPQWSRWTYPLLRIEHSKWLQQHSDRHPSASAERIHFALIAMNDLVQILALPDVSAKWIDINSA